MHNESDNPFDYIPTGPTQRGNSQATRRLEDILAGFRRQPEMVPAYAIPSPAIARRESEEGSTAFEQLCGQLTAIANGPQQAQYDLDCATLELNTMDGEESVRVLLRFWNLLQKPSNKIFLRNASAELLASLRTKKLLGGILLPADVTNAATE